MIDSINEKNLELTPCPLCGQEKHSVIFKFPPYKVVRCSSCQFYYLSPRLREDIMLSSYEKNDYFSSQEVGYASYFDQKRSLYATFERLMRNLEKRKLTGGSLLEIGCGYGYLLEAAKGYFESRTGIEFSRDAAIHAEKVADKIYTGGVESIPQADKFDCIILTQVIEHVYKPKKFLETVVSHLMPGGKLIVATPHMGSLWRKFMRRKWPSFKLPEHVLYFDKTTLRRLMHDSGIRQIEFVPYPHAFPLSLVLSKFNLPSPPMFEKLNIWMPATTIAACGVFADE